MYRKLTRIMSKESIFPELFESKLPLIPMKPFICIPLNKDVIPQNYRIRKFPPSSPQIPIRFCHSPNNVLFLVKGPSLVSGVAFGYHTRDFSTLGTLKMTDPLFG